MSDIGRRAFLAAAGAGVVLRAEAGRERILEKVRFGAEFFVNRTETTASIFEHFRRMADTGMTIARIFTLWDQVEPEQGRFDFSKYDAVYDAAARHGILIANTLCSEDPPGWMGLAGFYHKWKDLSDPRMHPGAELYIERVVRRYKDHAAHGVWLLQNEPGFSGEAGQPYALAAFGRWLQAKYGSVERLNEKWYRKLRRFEDAAMPEDHRSASWTDYAANLDWLRFRSDHLVEQLRWLHGQVERHHPGALTHVNPPGLTGNMPASGRDLWAVKPTVDFLGASMHAAWNFGMFSRRDFGIAYAFCCDLTRSASAPAPWWVTEMQAGPTIMTGRRPLNPTGGEITRWLWDAVGNGARGMVFWLWHPRTEGNEAGEWGLAGPNGEETERTRAVRAVAQVVEQHEAFFRTAKNEAAQTAILYNRDAMRLYAVDGWRRPTDELMLSVMGCYKALSRARVAVDFLDTDALEAGGAARYRVLYLPYSYALSAKSVGAIREFVRGGGTVWADGLVGWKDEEGRTFGMPPGPLKDVFGFAVEEMDATEEPGELWRCRIPAGAGEVLVRDAKGRPAAVRHRFGQGQAIYHGTAVSYAYMAREDARIARWIAAPAVRAQRAWVTEAPQGTLVRVLTGGRRTCVVLVNWGAAGRAVVQFPAPARRVVDLISGKEGATIELAAGGVAVLLADQ